MKAGKVLHLVSEKDIKYETQRIYNDGQEGDGASGEYWGSPDEAGEGSSEFPTLLD